jgi:hypothetical protein
MPQEFPQLPQDQLKLGLNEGQTEDAAGKEPADETGE